MYTVPGPPHGLTATTSDSRTLLLTWQPPADRNGLITGYTAIVTDLLTGVVSTYSTGGVTQLRVASLHPYYTYHSQVAAATEVGTGPYSQAVTIRMPEDGQLPALSMAPQIHRFTTPLSLPPPSSSFQCTCTPHHHSSEQHSSQHIMGATHPRSSEWPHPPLQHSPDRGSYSERVSSALLSFPLHPPGLSPSLLQLPVPGSCCHHCLRALHTEGKLHNTARR